jgi:type V secretory pathway adhesin AidA
VIGIARAGTTNVLLMVSLGSNGLGVEEALGSAGQRYYASVGRSATLTSNGGHANGDVVERNTTHTHTLHIEGDAICGTPRRS